MNHSIIVNYYGCWATILLYIIVKKNSFDNSKHYQEMKKIVNSTQCQWMQKCLHWKSLEDKGNSRYHFMWQVAKHQKQFKGNHQVYFGWFALLILKYPWKTSWQTLASMQDVQRKFQYPQTRYIKSILAFAKWNLPFNWTSWGCYFCLAKMSEAFNPKYSHGSWQHYAIGMFFS